jgi:hypothetical protein
MRNSTLVDLYSDYLLSGFGLSTSTGMSKMLDNAYSHDQISRFMSQPDMTQKEYWKSIKHLDVMIGLLFLLNMKMKLSKRGKIYIPTLIQKT